VLRSAWHGWSTGPNRCLACTGSGVTTPVGTTTAQRTRAAQGGSNEERALAGTSRAHYRAV
jgi:hypothetical protein